MVYGDIESSFQSLTIIKFMKRQFFYANGISELDIIFDWVKDLFTILLHQYNTPNIESAIIKLKNISYNTYEENINEYDLPNEPKAKIPMHKKAHFI